MAAISGPSLRQLVGQGASARAAAWFVRSHVLGKQCQESLADPDTYSMLSFRSWLDYRLEEVPDAASLALVIARSGAAGLSREGLGRAVRISDETLELLLRGLMASGQVVMVKVGGKIGYRAAG